MIENNHVIRFNDLSIANKKIKESLFLKLDSVLSSGRLLPSSETKNFEESMKSFFNINEARLVASGTSALEIALRCAKIGPGDEVIVPTMSWVSTAHAVSRISATPIFADIDNQLQIDINSIKSLITHKTKAVIAVHFGGLSANMDKLSSLLKGTGISLIEDCSQAFGNFFSTQKLGTFGDYGCFSLNPMKSLGAIGEAGLIISNHKIPIEHIYCGVNEEKKIVSIEGNNRADELQAAFLNVMFENFTIKSKEIIQIQKLYEKYLSNFIGRGSSNLLYCINAFVKNREMLESELEEKKIEFRKLHIPLMCDLNCYQSNQKDSRNSSIIASKLITLPFHKNLREEDIKIISDTVGKYLCN